MWVSRQERSQNGRGGSEVKRLIINADDFGYSVGVNHGIIDSYRRGVLTSTTLMPAMPGFEHAVGLAKENPGLGIGVHLTLTCGRPLLEGHKTLARENGDFPRKPYYLDERTVIDLDEVEREWTAQIERVLAAGIVPDHLDSHHHIHTYKGCESVFYALARRYHLPVRNSWDCGDSFTGKHESTPSDIVSPEKLLSYSVSYPVFRDDPRGYLDAIGDAARHVIAADFESHDVLELMTHPAHIDYSIMVGSSFNVARVAETELLTSPSFRTFLTEVQKIELVSFRSL